MKVKQLVTHFPARTSYFICDAPVFSRFDFKRVGIETYFLIKEYGKAGITLHIRQIDMTN
jgi:hypothetical protein